MNVLIIGAGAIGRATGRLLKENRKNQVVFWDTAPGRVKGQKPLARVVPSSDVVFFCLPSFGIRATAAGIKPYLNKKTVIVCLAKGIEPRTHFTMDRLLAKTLPSRQPFALLFGPMLASEFDQGACGHAVAAGAKYACELVLKLFSGTRLSVTLSDDRRGVALCGVLKNIYAIGLGIISAMRAGDNVRGAYVVVARAEMAGLVSLLGGRRRTVDGFAGLGDLVATGLNETSKNRQIGCALVKGKGKCAGTEGADAVAGLSLILGSREKRFPILRSLRRVLAAGAAPGEVIAAVCGWKK